MTYSFLIAAIGAIFISLLINRRRTALVLCGLLIPFSYLCGSGFASDYLLNGLQIYPSLNSPEWKADNLIILLAGGNSLWPENEKLTPSALVAGRVLETLRLFDDCKKSAGRCHLLLSGGDPSHSGKSEASVMAEKLEAVGVESSAIILEEESNNTIENAQKTAELLKNKSFDRLVLVTSGYHIRRSQFCFTTAGLSTIPAPADRLNGNFRIYPHAENVFLINLALHEYAGILQAWAKSLFTVH